jgi:hypothetical protein
MSQAGRGSSSTVELLAEPHAISRRAPIPFELLDLDGERLVAGARTRGSGAGHRSPPKSSCAVRDAPRPTERAGQRVQPTGEERHEVQRGSPHPRASNGPGLCAPAAYLENAEDVGSQQIVLPTTLEQFELTFAFFADAAGYVVGLSKGATR